MKSYLNKPDLKELFVEEIINHRRADQIVQGTYGKAGENFKGCAVGCSIHSLNVKLGKDYATNDHSVYETELGIPEWLARLEDTIFEGLSVEESKLWPEQFAAAIPVGVDLDPIKWKFCAFILKENIERVLTLDIADDLKKQVVDAIRGVLNLHERAIETGEWDESAWSAAEAARSAWSAWSAAESAWSAAEAARSAWSAARSAEAARSARSAEAAWSAWSAAESAWSAAESARSAWSAARSARSAWSAAESAESAESAARSAARSARSARSAWSAEAAYTTYATELLRLLREAK